MRYTLLVGVSFLLFFRVEGFSQNIIGGFDPWEYLELMKISTRSTSDSSYYNKFPAPERHSMLYQSPEMGLKNHWDLWIDSEKNTAVISIRGTTPDPVSWLENFYAGMVPAKGTLHISNDFQFDYQLAENPRAAVHVGWLVGTAFLARDIIPKIDSLYLNGVKEFLIMGHSQGGSIAYLLTSHLYFLQKQNKLPSDIRWKTYCSAAPKPGNLYFAYDYETMTRGGLAFNVINTADWVPQVPFSIQTIDDFNEVNPFKDADLVIKKQKFPERMVMKKIFNQLDKPTRKAQKSFEKYLGEKATKLIQKSLPEFQKPEFVSSNNYVRTGISIILQPDDIYKKEYPNDNPKTVFMHHIHKPYMDLLKRQYNLNSPE